MRELRIGAILVLSGLLLACGGEPPAGPATDSAEAPAGDTAGPDYDLSALLADADLKRGQTLFLQCRACHSLGEGEPHKVGPNLFGVFGQAAGVAPGFAFSDALKNSGIVWSAENMDPWLERPSTLIPGNKMVFIGIKEPADRASLIAYLQQETAAKP